jgi:CPA2 family monovalent cation:H+ antiporter-2
VDLAAAPRRALEVTMQVAGVLVIGAPILAVTQPFLRGVATAPPLIVLAALLGIAFWRSATNLQGHVRAGVQVIVEALGKRLPDENATATGSPTAPPDFDRLLPGLGAPLPVRLEEGSPAVGRTLTELNLRAITGATVLAIVRQGQGLVPAPHDMLEVGDVLALAGTHEALDSARQILGGETAASDGRSAET